jgi:oligosaccharide repeat unit polymerase
VIYLDFFMLAGLLTIVGYHYRRSGLLLSPATMWLIGGLILPVYVAYSFATTPESLGTIGQQFNATGMQEAADELLVVISVATICLILSYELTPRVLRQVTARIARAKIRSRLSLDELTAGACVSALFGTALVWFFFASVGEVPLLSRSAMTSRAEIVLTHPYRFVYIAGFTMASVGSVFLMAGLALKTLCRYKSIAYVVVLLVCGTNLLTANRTNFLGPLVSAGLIYFWMRSKKLTVVRGLLLVVLFLLVAAALQMLRARGSYGLDELVYEVLHGNTLFANFRDNSWVLLNVERHRYPLFYGKTILAGLLGFLPRSIFPFREQYGWGFFTLEIIHSKNVLHFGLGHVIFGDWYINFGYPGVIFEGLLIGFILRQLDSRLFFILSQARQIRDGDCYFAVFKVWFVMSILGYAFSSAASMLIYPYLAGFFVMLFVAIAVRTIFPRARRQEEFLVAATWRAAPIAGRDHSVGSR